MGRDLFYRSVIGYGKGEILRRSIVLRFGGRSVGEIFGVDGVFTFFKY